MDDEDAGEPALLRGLEMIDCRQQQTSSREVAVGAKKNWGPPMWT